MDDPLEFNIPNTVKTGSVESVALRVMMKKLLFIHEYVGESVSTRLKSHTNVNISTAYPYAAD